jgi:hypothetical protein
LDVTDETRITVSFWPFVASWRAAETGGEAQRVRAQQDEAAREMLMHRAHSAAATQREEAVRAQEAAGFAVDLEDDEYVA